MKRGGYLRRTKPLRPVSDKRRQAHKTRVRPVLTCELCPLLRGLGTWDAFRKGYHVGLYLNFDAHHVWTPPRWDEPENVVTCCRVAHEYVERYARFGRLVCTWAKLTDGTFARQLVAEKWGTKEYPRDPIAALHADADAGLFEVPESEWESFWCLVRESSG